MMRKRLILIGLVFILFPNQFFGIHNKSDHEEKTITSSCGFSANTASNVQFGTSRSDAIRMNTFTGVTNASTNPVGYIILVNSANSFTPFTNNTALPTANRTYQGSGQQVVHLGTTTNPNVIVNGLSSNTEYYFKIYAYFNNCGGTGSEISYQQVGYTTSNYTSGGSRTPLSITFSGATSANAAGASVSLSATSANSSGFLYQLVETTTGTSIINNSGTYTLQPGEAGTVVVDIKAEGSSTRSTIHERVSLTISKTDPTLSFSVPTYTVNDGTTMIDLTSLTSSNSAGVISYSILSTDPLGSTLSGTNNSILNVNNTPGSIAIRASQVATGNYNAKEIVVTTVFANSDASPIAPTIIFDNFSLPANSNQTLNATVPSGVSVNYSLGSSPTNAQITGSNFFSGIGNPSGGLPRVTLVTATTVANSNYTSASKQIEVSVTQLTPIITFNSIPNQTTNSPTFDLTATSDAVTISVEIPNDITYTSSNTAVATVSGSTVTMVGAGTTTITASQTGNYFYTDAVNVAQTLTVTDSSIIDQEVTVNPTNVGNCIGSADATVSLGSSQVNVQYTLRDNADNSVIGSPISGTGSGISFPMETLSANKTYNVLAEETTGSKTLVLMDKPSVTFNGTIQNQEVLLSQLNSNTVSISLSSSESGITYYLRNNSDNSVLQSLAGTGSSITFANESFTGVTTYNVVGVKTSSLNGQRNVLKLDGVNDFVRSGNDTFGAASAGVTVDMWINIPSGDDTDQNTTLIGTLLLGGNPDEAFRGVSTEAAGEAHELYVKINNGMIFAGGTPDHVTFYNTTPVSYPKNEWIHIAGVRDANSIKLYINGTQVGVVNSVPGMIFPVDGMSAGAEGAGFEAAQAALSSTNVLGGSLFSSRMWYRALSTSEVGTSMNTVDATTTSFASDLRINYPFSQTSGTAITNAVTGGSNHNATLLNGIGDATNWVQDFLFLDLGTCGQVQMGNTVTADPGKTAQNITFNVLANRTFGDATFNLSASSDSGLTAFTYTSSNTDVATISGNTVTIAGVGTTTITVNQAGDATYSEASAAQILTIDQRAITLTTQNQAVPQNGTLPTLTASITSGSLLSRHEIFIPIDSPSVSASGNQTISISTTQRADSTFDPNGLCEAGVCILNTAKDTNLTASYNITANNIGVLIVSDPNTGVVWDGSNGTNWNDAANWSGDAVPENVDITIPQTTNMPSVGAGVNGVVNDMIVQSSTLTIPDDSSVIVQGNLTNEGTITISSQGSTSGVLLVEGDPTGTVTYERGGFVANAWSIVSAPVAGQKIKDFVENVANDIRINTTVTPNRYAVAYYDDSQAVGSKWVYYDVDFLTNNPNTTFEVGRSYAMSRSTNGAVTFTGTLEVTTVSKSVAASEWNAIGNPFTAFIPANQYTDNNFIQDNLSNFDPLTVGVYIWDNTQSRYVARSLADATQTSFTPGQGFFVKTTSGITNMSFNSSRRSTQPGSGNTGFNRSEGTPSIQLKATLNDLTIDTNIKYFDHATLGLDPGYDLQDFSSESFDVYTKLVEGYEEINFTIQSLPTDDYETMVVPVGLIGTSGDQITFTAEVLNFPEGIDVYLEDRNTNHFEKLSEENASYQITLTEDTQGTGRFYLHTTSNVLSAEVQGSLQGVHIFTTSDKLLKIRGILESSTVKLYNILGSQVMNKTFEGTGSDEFDISRLPTGIYIVRLETKNGKMNKKVVIE